MFFEVSFAKAGVSPSRVNRNVMSVYGRRDRGFHWRESPPRVRGREGDRVWGAPGDPPHRQALAVETSLRSANTAQGSSETVRTGCSGQL